jgi:hypothetical protein
MSLHSSFWPEIGSRIHFGIFFSSVQVCAIQDGSLPRISVHYYLATPSATVFVYWYIINYLPFSYMFLDAGRSPLCVQTLGLCLTLSVAQTDLIHGDKGYAETGTCSHEFRP